MKKLLTTLIVFAAAAAAQITQPGGNASGVAGVASFNTRTGAVTLSGGDVGSALGKSVGAMVYTDQGNLFSSGLQDFSGVSLKMPVAAGYAPTTSGLFGYNSTNNTFVFGVNGLTAVNAYYTGTQPVSGHCVQFGANPGSLTDAGAACGTGGGGGITGPGTTTSGNIVVWNSINGTVLGAGIAAPASALVGVSDTQTLTNKSIAASQINSGTLAAAQMPALTGDVTTTAGSVATTVSKVNGAVVPASQACLGSNASSQLIAGTCAGGGGSGNTLTSPGGSMNIGGTSTASTLDVNTTYLNGLYPQLGAASTFTAGAKQAFQASSTTAGLRMVAAANPANPVGGDINLTISSLLNYWDGNNWDVLPYWNGTQPVSGHCVQWGPNGSQADAGAACGTGGTGGSGDSITSPGNSLTVGGTATATTLDVNTTYLGTLYPALATSNTYTPGAKQILQTTTTSSGLRIVPTAHATSGQQTGDINMTAGTDLEWYSGTAWLQGVWWQGTAPVSGNCTKWSGTAGQIVSVACPTGTIVGTSDTQTLTNKSIAASEVNSGTLAAAQMPAFTGDATNTAGSLATTVVKVNGTTVPTNTTADQILGTTAPSVAAWASIPNCQDASGNHINYNTTTHAFSCGTSTPAVGLFTLPNKLYFKSAICQGTSAYGALSLPGSATPTANCVTGTNTNYGVLTFTAAGQNAQDHFKLASDWTGAIDAEVVYRSAGTTGNVVFNVATACVADGGTGDPAFNTAQTISNAAQGTTNAWKTGSLTGITATGCSPNSEFYFKVGLDATTTVTGNVDLIGVRLTVRRSF